jgi:hypothetical protein
MPRHLAALVSLAVLAGSLLAVADPVAPADDAKVGQLVAALGSPDFAKREAAEKELGALGPAALAQLRAACRSANPEVARRAADLVARIEHRIGNEQALAPTLVELTAAGAPLSGVLADLSKQSGYTVVLGGPSGAGADDRLESKVTVKTGKVPFWAAVLAVCAAADLQIAAADGYLAPGAEVAHPRLVPRPVRGPRPVRPAPVADKKVVLDPRGANPKRPAAVYGAVCVEAFPVPAAAVPADAVAAVLQVWAEPKLNWQTTRSVRVDRAATADGQRLAALPDAGPPPLVVRGNDVVMVKQVGGGVVFINPNANVPLPPVAGFTPNPRQAVVKLKPGDRPAAALAALTGVVRGTVRTGTEPLVSLTGLAEGKAAAGGHPSGVEMKATLVKKGAKWEAVVELSYEPGAVLPEGDGNPQPGRRGGLSGFGSHGMLGLRVTDADGNTYALSPTQMQQTQRDATRMEWRVTFGLSRPDTETGDPDAVVFRGTYAKPVEVPFALAGVPLAGGPK